MLIVRMLSLPSALSDLSGWGLSMSSSFWLAMVICGRCDQTSTTAAGRQRPTSLLFHPGLPLALLEINSPACSAPSRMLAGRPAHWSVGRTRAGEGMTEHQGAAAQDGEQLEPDRLLDEAGVCLYVCVCARVFGVHKRGIGPEAAAPPTAPGQR